ncbi:MAG: hypothetical protein J2P43_01445, partial [Candidatus Dormibacteraeota bacterium]|nr:hypothetical protein [Candidatus Dormibacteraeota bacterium]
LSVRSFTRSTLAPEPGSRRLYAGCRLGSTTGLPQARPEAGCILGFDIGRLLLDASSVGSRLFAFPVLT